MTPHSATESTMTCLDMALGMDMVGDEQALGEILDLARTSLKRDLPAIDACLAAGDARGANQMLHAIKGFAPIFCVQALVDEVTQVETLGKTANAQQLTDAYTHLAPKLHRLLDELVLSRDSLPK